VQAIGPWSQKVGVIELLEATARTVPHVLREPAPMALLLSFGDYAINYSLASGSPIRWTT
jgi:small-conductance mechanosensitive channel